MDESNGWEFRRYVTLLIVLMLHMAVLALLMMTSPTRIISALADTPLELVFISPPSPPKIRAENSRPQRLSSNPAVTVAPPVLDSFSASPSIPASGTEGHGSAVDWAAEARRAVQAFDIRSHQPASNQSVSGSPAEDHWWPRAQHHAGDQFKTANGDWIVWINESCYQLTSPVQSATAPGASPPPTICLGQPGAPRNDPTSP
jgi:hypothetical protein